MTEQLKADLVPLLQNTGDAIADVLDQLIKCDWVDSLGHEVKFSSEMLRLKDQLFAIMAFRSRHLSYEYVTETEK